MVFLINVLELKIHCLKKFRYITHINEKINTMEYIFLCGFEGIINIILIKKLIKYFTKYG